MLRSTHESVHRSNCGGWHSSNTLYKSQEPSINWLINRLYELGSLCLVREQQIPPRHRITMPSCWANINESGDWNAPHAHQPCEWAGVCYIDVCDDLPEQSKRSDRDGNLLFINPIPFGHQYNRPPTVDYRPEAGKVFIFPGYLMHMVAPHFHDKPRISVAFNLTFSPIKPNEDRGFYPKRI